MQELIGYAWLMMHDNTMRLNYIHDPMCSWCWAFRPVWTELQKQLPESLQLRYLLGGLAPDSNIIMPADMQQMIQRHWQTIQKRVPATQFNFDFWTQCRPRRSTYPACRAVIAAKQQNPNKENAMSFGIKAENIFDMWDWVGGRFSLWSAIGLPIALDIGFDQFKALLEGAHEMDEHFVNTPLEQNMPVIMALLSVWNTTFLGSQSQAILPYDQTLHMLTAYLQQAEMESNGKSVNWFGETVDYATVPSIWGELGINGQHAFYQYLHQSNNVVPADFIGSVASVTPVKGHHETLMSNFFAQTQALMTGVNEEQVRADLKAKGRTDAYIDMVAPHKVHKGNRPTNTILLKRIDPATLGNLIAMYEHKIFVQGIVLQICSFDQWGVELGKGLAAKIQQELATNKISTEHDCSTLSLLKYYQSAK